MTSPHSPASRESDPVPEAMREAVARVIDPVAWNDFDRFGADNSRTARDRLISLLTADRVLKSGPIAKELDALRAHSDLVQATLDAEMEIQAEVRADLEAVRLENHVLRARAEAAVETEAEQRERGNVWRDRAQAAEAALSAHRAAQRSQDEEIAALKRAMMIQARELKRLDPHGETPVDLEAAMSALRRALAKPEPTE